MISKPPPGGVRFHGLFSRLALLRLHRSSQEPRPLLLPQSVAFALDRERVAVVQQPVEDRRRQDVVAEDRAHCETL